MTNVTCGLTAKKWGSAPCLTLVIEYWTTLLFRPRRSSSAAAYSRQTFPWTICRSVRMYVHASVGLSSALWKNGGLDPDAVWYHRSDRSRDEACSGVWGSVHGRGSLGANLGLAIVTNGNFTAYVCNATAMRPSSHMTLGRLVNIENKS